MMSRPWKVAEMSSSQNRGSARRMIFDGGILAITRLNSPLSGAMYCCRPTRT